MTAIAPMRKYMSGLLAVLVAATAATPARAQPTTAAVNVSDLPLTWNDPQGARVRVTAVILTGDGGWAELVKSVAVGLTSKGIGVVGFNSRAWLSSAKSPDATAAAVVRVINAARQRWPSDRIVLVGYSRGADILPFVATRLPAGEKAQLAGLAFFGLAPTASFEFHLMDLIRDTNRPSDLLIAPELEKLRGVRMVCVYGTDEPASGCRDAPATLITKDGRRGGHHFDQNTDALVAHVLALLTRPER
ncbi:AcvB/VirJ family lysyl-phosphatidylglycerol hydrolase [Gemmatimonas sp.]|uniref:AcvB/VirJ family lysyl-phosphatidylglycerol hydrolase n=1 Tax=Gemmatimonas sp. TaxID=1962908 RepID=UPI003983CD8B